LALAGFANRAFLVAGRFQSRHKQVIILFCTQICLIALIKSDQSGKSGLSVFLESYLQIAQIS